MLFVAAEMKMNFLQLLLTDKNDDIGSFESHDDYGKRARFNTCSSSARGRSAVTKTCITFDLMQNNNLFFTKIFVRDCRNE